MRYRYSRWDGTQDLAGVEPDELMDALSDAIMADGDVRNALNGVIRRGLQHQGEQRTAGMHKLLEQLRTQRQAELERYNLDSILQDMKERVKEILAAERDGLRHRLESSADDCSHGEMLRSIARKKEDALDRIPVDPASAVTELSEYEFLDEGARAKFRALTDMLERHMVERHFRSMEQLLRSMSADGVENVKSMLRDLNSLLQGYKEGTGGDIGAFLEQHGRHFSGVSSIGDLVDELYEQASHSEALMASMSPEMRGHLDRLMASVLADHALREELGQVTETLESMAPRFVAVRQYPFSGNIPISLEEGLGLMRRMHDLDGLERAMRESDERSELDSIDEEEVRRLMGESARADVAILKGLEDTLERVGYAERNEHGLELTVRGVRRIGQKALQDIFTHLRDEGFGEHAVHVRGTGIDRSEDSKPYEFGDTFHLHLHASLMNAVERAGPGTPISLRVEDFEVFETEHMARASTVLMLDMSRSMPLRGCLEAARRVALALNALIRLHFPRDELHIIGFSDYARHLRPDSLHRVSWGDYVYGTNMQHGFMLARRLLARRGAGTRQVILITDGEPTAHMEGGRVQFAYPPTFRTIQETLREVRRCTQDGIVINTFMLDRGHHLTDFVDQMTHINRGRAFFATPERLGDYIVVDYVRSRQPAVRCT